LGHNYDEVFRSFVGLPDAIRRYPGSEEPGYTACAMVFQKPQGFFGGLLRDEPWRAKRFEEAMQAVSRGDHDSSHLVQGFDWAKIANGLVVDVSSLPFISLCGFASDFRQLFEVQR
jgi:6-hydroxytryprostatin B O-methyltransferase